MVTSILPVVVEKVELRRRGKQILGPLDLTLGGEGITVLMGPNGSGKTSLLRLLHGMERLSGGRIAWSGPPGSFRAQQAFVFQTPTLMRRRVLDNIAYPLRLRGRSRAEARQTATRMAGAVGLTGLTDGPAEVLSGGERQKMALARALILEPQVLLLDEPCANLDPHATRDIEAILTATRATGTRIFMSTHDAGQARRLAGDILFLSGGKLLDHAPATTFFAGPKSAEARAFLQGDLPI